MSGTARCWDHADCPLGECDGELQQQDDQNVMCMSCGCIWTHTKNDTQHHLCRVDGVVVDVKPREIETDTYQEGQDDAE